MMCAPTETGLGRHRDGGITHKTNQDDLKSALRQAHRQQNALRKSQTKTWDSERTAFDPPQPQAVAKERGVRNALRRQTRKLKRTPPPPSTPVLDDSRPSSLYRSDSFDYGDESKRRLTQVQFAPVPAAPHPRDTRSDAKTQLLNLKAQHKLRRAQQKAANKRTNEQEKAQRQALARQVKQEKILEYLRALTSRHPRQNLKHIRQRQNGAQDRSLAQEQYFAIPHSRRYSPVSPESWLETPRTLSHDLVSPIASFGPQSPVSQQRYSFSPATVPRWSDFASKDELLAHLGGVQDPPKALKPQELPAYESLSASQQKAGPVEVSTELPDREIQMCRPKPNLVYCDICSTTVSLSGVFYSCTICGPREGGIVCSSCQPENRKCHGGLHDLESSMQVVRRASPASSWGPTESASKNDVPYSKTPEPSESSAAISRISADTASQSLCLASLQKKMTKVEAGIETQSKTTERLASWLEEALERQRDQATDLTKSLLDEFRAERMINLNTIKRLSTKRKPRGHTSESSNPPARALRDGLRERELALREREFTLREREMALQERQEASKERAEKPMPPVNPLPSQNLAAAPSQENRLMLDVVNKLNRIEGLFALPHPVPSVNVNVVDQVIERAMGQLSLVTSGFREHAGVKRKADSSATNSSIQSTPITGLSTSSFLQPPSRTLSRGNQDEDEDDGHSPKRAKNQPNPAPETDKRLLACPYAKYNFQRYSHHNATELKYRGCSSCVLSDISRLKQHLYRVHQYPEHFCPRCFDDLLSKEQLNQHLRDGCEPRECPYPEKFSDSTKLKRKWPRKSRTDCWYMVFKILFPGVRLPASPYAEDLATSATAVGIPNTPPQPVPTLSLSPEVISDVVRRQLERRSITDGSHQHAFLFSLVQDATIEALGLISASPTPISNSNPSSAVPQSGTYATSPGPDSAFARQDDTTLDPDLLSSAGTGTINSTFGTLGNLQDLSSLGSGVNGSGGARLSPVVGPPLRPSDPSPPTEQPTSTTMAMSSNQSSGTFSGLSPLPGTENLMDFDEDLLQMTSGENAVLAPTATIAGAGGKVKPSNSTRTVDSGYGSMMLRNDDGVLLDCYPSAVSDGMQGIGVGSGTGSYSVGDGGASPANRSRSSGEGESLIDPEMSERLVREHGDDFIRFSDDWSGGMGIGGIGSGFGVDVFGPL